MGEGIGVDCDTPMDNLPRKGVFPLPSVGWGVGIGDGWHWWLDVII